MPRCRPATSTISCSSRSYAAILAAVRKAGAAGLSEQDFGRTVQAALGFTAVNRERRREWMLDPGWSAFASVNGSLGRLFRPRIVARYHFATAVTEGERSFRVLAH